MQEKTKFYNIYKSETWNTGGGSMVDTFFHKNGWVITLNDEVVCLYRSEDEFWNDDGEKCVDGLMIPRKIIFEDYPNGEFSWIVKTDCWDCGGGYIVDRLYLSDDWFVCVSKNGVGLYSSDDQFHGEEDKPSEGFMEFSTYEKTFTWIPTGKEGTHSETGELTKEYEKSIDGELTGERIWMNEDGEFRGQ